MKSNLAQPIDPTRGPLFGYALFKVSDTRYFWYERYHHIIMDDFGAWLVARRVAYLYTRLSLRQTPDDRWFGSLAALLEDDASYRISEQFAQDRQYWLDYLAHRPPPVRLGGHHPTKSDTFLRDTVYLPNFAADRLRSIAHCVQTTLSRILISLTAIFLHRLTGATDLILGLPVATRNSISRSIPAMVSNVLPLCLAVHPRMTLSEIIDQVSCQVQRGLKHQRFPIGDLRRDIGGSFNERSLFAVRINFLRSKHKFSFAGNHGIEHNLSLGPVDDLSIAIYDRADGGPLRVDFDGNPTVHTAPDLAAYGQRYLRLLSAIDDCRRTVGSFEIFLPRSARPFCAAGTTPRGPCGRPRFRSCLRGERRSGAMALPWYSRRKRSATASLKCAPIGWRTIFGRAGLARKWGLGFALSARSIW